MGVAAQEDDGIGRQSRGRRSAAAVTRAVRGIHRQRGEGRGSSSSQLAAAGMKTCRDGQKISFALRRCKVDIVRQVRRRGRVDGLGLGLRSIRVSASSSAVGTSEGAMTICLAAAAATAMGNGNGHGVLLGVGRRGLRGAHVTGNGRRGSGGGEWRVAAGPG